MPRLFDLIAVVAVAVVLLLPKPSLHATPAIAGEPIELDRVAELEDARFVAPDGPHAVDTAVALADEYLRLGQPEWALATLAPFARPPGGDPRAHLVRATAYAERLEAQAAVDEVERGLQACDALGPPRCRETDRIRLNLIRAPMAALVAGGIDPRKDPKGARDAVRRVLRASRAPAAAPPAAVAPSVPAPKSLPR
jgi:hypothetical protein